jgi:hypothetical protein
MTEKELLDLLRKTASAIDEYTTQNVLPEEYEYYLVQARRNLVDSIEVFKW